MLHNSPLPCLLYDKENFTLDFGRYHKLGDLFGKPEKPISQKEADYIKSILYY